MVRGADPEACNDHNLSSIDEFYEYHSWTLERRRVHDDKMARMLEWFVCEQDRFQLDPEKLHGWRIDLAVVALMDSPKSQLL